MSRVRVKRARVKLARKSAPATLCALLALPLVSCANPGVVSNPAYLGQVQTVAIQWYQPGPFPILKTWRGSTTSTGDAMTTKMAQDFFLMMPRRTASDLPPALAAAGLCVVPQATAPLVLRVQPVDPVADCTLAVCAMRMQFDVSLISKADNAPVWSTTLQLREDTPFPKIRTDWFFQRIATRLTDSGLMPKGAVCVPNSTPGAPPASTEPDFL